MIVCVKTSFLFVSCVVVAACKAQETPKPEPISPVTPAPVAPAASTTAVLPPSAPPLASMASAAASATAVTSASARASNSASGKATSLMPTATGVASTVASSSASLNRVKPPAFASLKGEHFTLGLMAPGSCEAGKDCAATLTLTATEGYHINKEYPYKFTTDARDGVTFLAKDGSAFSKANGDFQQTSETVGTTRVGFRATKTFELSGTFKMSVCSDANCQIEIQKIALQVPIE
jgi:hypothetical protein